MTDGTKASEGSDGKYCGMAERPMTFADHTLDLVTNALGQCAHAHLPLAACGLQVQFTNGTSAGVPSVAPEIPGGVWSEKGGT